MVVNGLTNKVALEEVAHIVEDMGGKALPILADVSDPDVVERMVQVADDLKTLRLLPASSSRWPHRSRHAGGRGVSTTGRLCAPPGPAVSDWGWSEPAGTVLERVSKVLNLY